MSSVSSSTIVGQEVLDYSGTKVVTIWIFRTILVAIILPKISQNINIGDDTLPI